MKERTPYRTATVTLPPGLLDQLDALAESEARTRSDALAKILREHFRRQEGRADGADR